MFHANGGSSTFIVRSNLSSVLASIFPKAFQLPPNPTTPIHPQVRTGPSLWAAARRAWRPLPCWSKGAKRSWCSSDAKASRVAGANTLKVPTLSPCRGARAVPRNGPCRDERSTERAKKAKRPVSFSGGRNQKMRRSNYFFLRDKNDICQRKTCFVWSWYNEFISKNDSTLHKHV